MSYAPPPPPGPPPPPSGAYGSPPGYPPPGGFYYGPPMAAGAPVPHSARGGSPVIVAVFIGALIGVAVLVAIIVLASQPKQPTACPPGQFCPPGPPPSLVPAASPTQGASLPPARTPAPTPAGQTPGPIGSAVPTPASEAAPYVAGKVWRSSTLGYSFEYDGDSWELVDEEAAYAQLRLGIRNSDIRFEVIGFPASTSVDSALKQTYDQVDTFVIGRTENDRPYDALLGAGIGYIRGKGGTFLGTYKNTDGTPGDPVGITAMAATDGTATVVVLVRVANPDADFHGETLQHIAREIADDIVKTFLWTGGG